MKRITALDPLRGLASFAVVWFHLAHASSYVADGHWLNLSGTYGKLGVQVFFVISGFILPYALHARRYRLSHYRMFVLKRIVRLDPPYLATILFVVSVSYASTFVPGWNGAFTYTWPQLLGHLGYLNAFLGLPWVVSVFWTLAIEFQFYLLLALLFPLLAHRQGSVRLGALLVFCAGVFFVPHTGPTSFRPFVFQHVFLFATGIAAFWHYHSFIRPWAFAVLVALSTAGTALTLGVPEALAGLFALAVITFAPDLKAGRVLTYLGTISYSLYLIHVPIGDRLLGILDRLPFIPKPVGVLLAVAASIAAADVLYRLTERPSQRLSASLSYRKRPETEPLAAAGIAS